MKQKWIALAVLGSGMKKTISIDLVILLRQIHRHCISPLSLALTFELEKCAFKFVNIF